MLKTKLQENNCKWYQADGDVDSLIVHTTIKKSSEGYKTAVVGQDIDFVVILTALTPSDDDIYFYEPKK